MGWDTRLTWAGEVPAAGAVLLQRFEVLNGSGATKTLDDAVNPSRTWTLRNAAAATAFLSAGRWGNNLSLNRSAPATEQTSLTVPWFAGLWPSSGKLLFRVWASLSFAMSFTPIISTRNTTGKTPLVYLSTTSDGRPRAMIYDAAGTAILDQSETAAAMGWTPVANEWVCYLWLVDMDAKTSQIGLVRRTNGQSFVGPVRTFTGTPNAACEADFEVGTLSPTAAYWAGGYFDEVAYWQPATASMADLVAGVVRSLPARGRDSVEGAGLTVTDTTVTASASATLITGAEPVDWDYAAAPTVTVAPTAPAATPQAYLSTDTGATWTGPTPASSLPAEFTGWLRWQVPLFAGESFTGVSITEPPPPPPTAVNDAASTSVNTPVEVDLLANDTWTGAATVTIAAHPTQGSVTVTGGVATYTPHLWASGVDSFVYQLTDATGWSATATVTITVGAVGWDPPPAAEYAFVPPVVLDDNDEPAEMLPRVWDAKVFTEINGEQTIAFTIAASDPRAPLVVCETRVMVAGEVYAIRNVELSREAGPATIRATGEAAWYDLGRKPKLPVVDWGDSQPGPELAAALEGTGWTVGAVTVSTRRTWQQAAGNPLEVLRQIQSTHGGDLVFDNTARTVSLLVTSGQPTGVFFTAGKNLTSVRRILDTTQLVTRLHAATEDGQTFASINGGADYVDNHQFTTKVIDGHLTFKAGTNPYTMLAMTTASAGRYSKPRTTYEAKVLDLSALAGRPLEALRLGDEVTIYDEQLGIHITHKIVRLELDLMEPWNTVVTLSSTLRELGSDNGTDAGVLTTGADIDTKDLVPFNMLRNARFDNGLAHWAASGATVVDGGVTGAKHVELAGGGVRWIEQTFAPDTRDTYTVSFQLSTAGYAEGVIPIVDVIAEITYEDATTETITQQVS